MDLNREHLVNYTYIEKNDSQADEFENQYYPEMITIINCALNIPLMLMSIIENSLVLAAILTNPSLHSPSTVFLCCLAVSDLLAGFVAQPVYIATELNPTPSLYHAMFTLTALACGASLCTMAAISVDRYMALRYHMRYPFLMTTKRAIYTLAAAWLAIFFVSCLSFWNKNLYFFAIAFGVAICIAISSFAYIKIYCIVRQHRLQIKSHLQAVHNLNAGNNLNMLRLKKSAFNTFIYYICMILCYSPLFTSMIILAVQNGHDTKAWNFADTVSFMNSSINPILYCWRFRELRKAVLKTLRKMSCKQTE